jgi:hypothetical protein
MEEGRRVYDEGCNQGCVPCSLDIGFSFFVYKEGSFFFFFITSIYIGCSLEGEERIAGG